MKARNHGSPILGEMRQDIDRHRRQPVDLRDDTQLMKHAGQGWGVFLPLS